MSPASPAPRSSSTLTVLQPHAAGLDIGAREIGVAVPADRDPEPVRCFGTLRQAQGRLFTQDLEKLVAWLVQGHIATVALESTGCQVGQRVCRAFPEGIPDDIWEGKHTHCEPYLGDHEVRFELNPSANPQAVERALARLAQQ